MYGRRVYFTGMLLLFLCFTVVTCACPENCIYSHNERNRTTASCRLEKNSDYDLLMGLPKNTIELECTVKGRFIEQLFQVQHLLKLEKLVLWPDKFSRLNSYSSHPGSLGFDKPDIFYNLRELRHLGIHISLSDLNATIFQSLEHLQVTDLSHTEGLSASLIASIRMACLFSCLNSTGSPCNVLPELIYCSVRL